LPRSNKFSGLSIISDAVFVLSPSLIYTCAVIQRRHFKLKLRSGTLALGERTLIMGVVNVTPDSFSDGGHFFDSVTAVNHALALEESGADLIDIGGESTRPGASTISAEEEMSRVLPVLLGLRGKLRIPISIDTRKAVVADAAIAAGAEIVNDVSALQFDPALGEVIRRRKVPVILMHMRGNPANMQKGPFVRDVLRDVSTGLRAAVKRVRNARIPKSQIILDPGIGFGKSYRQNFELLAHLDRLAVLGFPLLVGTSRKAFLGGTIGTAKAPAPASERIWGTAATIAATILGGAHIIRVHEVSEMAKVARVADAIAAEL
jgi:dihydropteroate synthase